MRPRWQPCVGWHTAAPRRCRQTVLTTATESHRVPADDNRLIEQLPRPDRLRLLDAAEAVQLLPAQVLQELGEPTRHVYFPSTGYIALVALVDQQSGLAVGLVGFEGMLGVQLAMGVVTAPQRALVQGPGTAWRIGRVAFRRELARSSALRGGLSRYVALLMAQLASTAACLHFHEIGPRLARWLLMNHDRAGVDHFHITHELLAGLLGARRVGITVAAGRLQRLGLIHYHRGEVQVLDRAGLEAAACGCYESDRL